MKLSLEFFFSYLIKLPINPEETKFSFAKALAMHPKTEPPPQIASLKDHALVKKLEQERFSESPESSLPNYTPLVVLQPITGIDEGITSSISPAWATDLALPRIASSHSTHITDRLSRLKKGPPAQFSFPVSNHPLADAVDGSADDNYIMRC